MAGVVPSEIIALFEMGNWDVVLLDLFVMHRLFRDVLCTPPPPLFVSE